MVVIDEFPSSTLACLLCSNEFNEARQRRENPACSSSLSFSGSVTKNSLRRHAAVTRIRPLVGTFTRYSRCRKSFPTLIVQSFPDDVSATTAVVSTTLATLIGFGGFRLFVYFRIQYMIAAMLGRYVPRGGSKVLDMDIHEGRNLYYYPSDVATVIAIATEKNREVIKAQAIRAGVPVDVKVRAINFLSLPSNSLDAVVSTYCLSNLKEEEIKAALREAVRLLKPGKPLIFVENVKANGEFVASCQILFQKAIRFFGVQSVPPKEIAKVLEEVQGLEKLSYETVFDYQDPHIVGIAVKQMETTESRSKKRGNKKTASV